MPATVLLEDIVEALELASDEAHWFVDLENGEVHGVSKELLNSAEEAADEDEELDIPAWQKDEWTIEKRIMFHRKNFERLPTKFDVHEWQIMRDFADSVQNPQISRELQDAIHGAGAFRMFKSVIRRLKIEQQWYAFHLETLKEIAREWCQEHGVLWK
jgi:hypothetical protein